jgi:glycosyltransferase involved in cell wall biosynthesis
MVRTAFVSTYPPRACGLASFTAELSRVTPDREIVVLHSGEPADKHAFEVHHRIRRDERPDYARTAASLARCADVASIQYDAAVWGGEGGEAVLDFAHALTIPSVATLHALPQQPTEDEREIIAELVRTVRASVVMSKAAAALLAAEYGADPRAVAVIPYGVPDVPSVAPESIAPALGLEGVEAILSFGFLEPGKGFELLIEALPAIVAAHPRARYVILGATHPDARRDASAAYRATLASRAAKLGVASAVRFVDEFVGRNVLTRWLQAATVFVTPTPDLGSMLSGPLTYAMATGRAIVSTRYPYATELLADGRGLLVDAAPAALAGAVIQLFEHPADRAAMGERAHEHARSMAWGRVGADYQALFERVVGGTQPPADLGTGPRSIATA